MPMGCETDMEISEDETDCPTGTQSESIISNTIQTNLYSSITVLYYNKSSIIKVDLRNPRYNKFYINANSRTKSHSLCELWGC